MLWPHRLNRLQYIARRVGNLQEFARRYLGCAGIVLVGKLDGSAFEAPALEFFSERKSQYTVSSPGNRSFELKIN